VGFRHLAARPTRTWGYSGATMADESDRPDPEGASNARADAPESATRPTAEPTVWWYPIARTAETMLREQPRRYKPIAKPLRILARSAHLERMLLAAQQSDPVQNAATRPPSDEGVQLAALWAVELYTPSTVGRLARALQKLRWLHRPPAKTRTTASG
jgi:hypothetical protein